VIPSEFVLGLACGLLVAAGLYAGLWWWARRSVTPDRPPSGALDDRDAHLEDPAGVDALAEPAYLAGIVPRLATAPDSTSAPSSPVARGPPTNDGPTGLGDPVRLSQRVILHVYGQGDLPMGAVAPAGLCQAGIGDALGVRQAGLAAVLRRLEAAGILTTERGHVQGHDRRLKIYRLSTRGLGVARELRTRALRSRPPRPAADPGSPGPR